MPSGEETPTETRRAVPRVQHVETYILLLHYSRNIDMYINNVHIADENITGCKTVKSTPRTRSNEVPTRPVVGANTSQKEAWERVCLVV